MDGGGGCTATIFLYLTLNCIFKSDEHGTFLYILPWVTAKR
jgi:hypothetical protein